MKKLFFLLWGCFVALQSACCAETLCEDFENPAKFSRNKAAKAKMELSSVEGYKNNGLRVDFNLKEDHFVEIGVPAKLNLDEVNEFYWYLKGNANGCLIEIKWVDEDGSTFGSKVPISGITETGWKKFTLPKKLCHYMWGGDTKIDKIKELWVAFSRGIAKEAYVVIDELGYTTKQPGQPDFEIELNQVGYHPTDKKFFVVRTENRDNLSGKFTIQQEGKTVLKGNLLKTDFKDWEGTFLTGDFSSVQTEGTYSVGIELKIGKATFKEESSPFKIGQTVLSSETLSKELNYMNYQRCGVRCHKKDPVMGGYHDTLFDISKRMWSIPSLIYGMARYVKEGPVHPDLNNDKVADDLDELLWGFKFITDMPEPDGTVSWAGIEADFLKVMTYGEFIARIGPLKPEDDNIPRIKYKEKNFHSTAFNLVALINSIYAAKDAPWVENAKNDINKAWEWLDKYSLKESRDYGAYLWVATELYKYSGGDKKYLYRIGEVVPKLLELQALDYGKFQNNACGDFYFSKVDRDFRFQYKYVSFNIAINLALINLCEILPHDDPLWFDIYYANRVFGENHIKGIASATPYRQAAVGLEKDASGFYKLNYFSGMEGKLAAAENHGLNCDMLAKGYVALKWGGDIEDLALEEFADNQGNWVLGENPLGYCMLIGAGKKNPVIMAEYFDKPAVPGIIPNGIVGGKNENPEWWGDGPSSGEDWLPHNAAYFAYLSLIDSKAALEGTILSDGQPVANASITIGDRSSKKEKEIKLQSNDQGKFGPCELVPQKSYEIKIEKEGKKIERNVNLLSGAKKNLTLDFSRNFLIKVTGPKSLKSGKTGTLSVQVSKNAVGKDYRIRVRGAKVDFPKEGTITGKKMRLNVEPTGTEPFLLRFEIKGTTPAFKEIYAMPAMAD